MSFELPSEAETRRSALIAHQRLLDQVRREARHLLDRQCAGLRDPALAEPSRLTAFLVETTLEAIRLLKADDAGMSRANWALARDAAQRHPPVDIASSALLLDLLARAAEDVVWGIPAAVAHPWCHARNPDFWGRAISGLLESRSIDSGLLAMLEASCRQAGDAVARTLDGLHCAAVEEQGRLERIAQFMPTTTAAEIPTHD